MDRSQKILCVAWLCVLACAACDPGDPAPAAPDPAEGEGSGAGPSAAGTIAGTRNRKDAGASGAQPDSGAGIAPDAGISPDAGVALDGGSFGMFNEAGVGALGTGVLPPGSGDAAVTDAGTDGGPRDARAEGG